MTSLAWKINRLRLMGAPEIMYRVKQLAQKKAFKYGLGAVTRTPSADLTRFGRPFICGDVTATDDDSVRAAADRVLAGQWDVFALKRAQLGFPPVWNRDPRTGIDAPMGIGKSMDYRDDRIVGDIKYLWEPSRHLALVTLGAAWRVTRDKRYVDGAVALLTSWMDQCPYPMGVHWASSLELAVRLLNWAVAWHLFGGADGVLFEGDTGVAFRQRWLSLVYQHCHFIDGFYSKHSSANNHLFGEYMGLFIGSVTWPCWKESETWQHRAKQGLETEALLQTGPDGVNREQAVYYHHEVMDMMLWCYLAGAANGIHFSAAYLERLKGMAVFLSSVMDARGHVPMIGDADDALMVKLSYEAGWCHYRSLLTSCALLFEEPALKAQAGRLDDKNLWLFGEMGRSRWNALAAVPGDPVREFPDGGYYIIGRDWHSRTEIKAVVDCSPLGYLSIAAHGHADALSMVLSVGGEEMLIDPGTYAYHTQKKWRDYFRSTAAHNTLRIDGVDQSVIGGNFMWLDKAVSRLCRFHAGEREQVFEGEHNGYRRLEDPVVHRRRIEFDTVQAVFNVTDLIECRGRHDVEIFWHFAEHCKVEATAEGLQVSSGSGRARLALSVAGIRPVLRRGDEASPSGWISRSFDHKEPTTTGCFSATVTGRAEFHTQIRVLFSELLASEGLETLAADTSGEPVDMRLTVPS